MNSQKTSFDGFPRECLDFYAQLAQNNNKIWFQEHKKDYDNYVMEPARDFVLVMGERLREFVPGIHADPRVNKSIFRINRDVRFTNDKSPYKTNLGMWFWEGEHPRMENSGFYFHLELPNLMIGTGIYLLPKNLLKAYRDAVVDPDFGATLVQAIKEVSANGPYQIGGKHYKRVPRGYDKDHENAELLLYNGLYAGHESEVPEEFFSSKLVDYCMEKYTDTLPIHRWLVDMLADVA
jgi:uncharacterized protein (TIGR02453 family)